jgi:hypothetical protein
MTNSNQTSMNPFDKSETLLCTGCSWTKALDQVPGREQLLSTARGCQVESALMAYAAEVF